MCVCVLLIAFWVGYGFFPFFFVGAFLQVFFFLLFHGGFF